jgi:hypothetical protein
LYCVRSLVIYSVPLPVNFHATTERDRNATRFGRPDAPSREAHHQETREPDTMDTIPFSHGTFTSIPSANGTHAAGPTVLYISL